MGCCYSRHAVLGAIVPVDVDRSLSGSVVNTIHLQGNEAVPKASAWDKVKGHEASMAGIMQETRASTLLKTSLLQLDRPVVKYASLDCSCTDAKAHDAKVP